MDYRLIMAGFGSAMAAGIMQQAAGMAGSMAPSSPFVCQVCGGEHTTEEHQAKSFVDQVMGLEATNPDPVVTQPKTEQSTFGLNWGQTIPPVDPITSTPWGPGHPYWPGGA